MTATPTRPGPLAGLRVVEFAGIGPGPYAAMLLADMGADIIRVDRPGARPRKHDISLRGRRIVTADLKNPADLEKILALLDQAEALIEGFRPGVMERLGLGPDVITKRNPKLVYARMTGWGQTGPLAKVAGHDITYIAITGALHSIGPRGGKPTPPLNLVGDYGGGSLYLAMGLLAAVLSARQTGQGQVVDCAISDCVVHMLSMFHSLQADRQWTDQRGDNMLDGGAHFYTTYTCKDGKHLAIGAIEPQFYAELRAHAGLTDPAFDAQRDHAAWPTLREQAQKIFATKTRDEWTELLHMTESCAAPVLTLREAAAHPHLAARQAFVTRDGLSQSAPAPRFSRTPSAAGDRPVETSLDAGWAETV